jgi:chromosomal replication initiator protein
MSNGHIWRTALEQLRREMSRAQFETWLRGTHLVEAGADGAAVLQVRTTFARELLETRFRERIEAAIAQATGRPCALRIVVGDVPGEGGEGSAEALSPAGVPRGQRVALAQHAPRSTGVMDARRTGAGGTSGKYVGPGLFASAAAELGDEPAPGRPRRPMAPGAARHRSGGGSGRAAPSTGRVRAAAERATFRGAAPGAVAAAGAPESAGERRAQTRPERTPRRDERNEVEAMNESSNVRMRREPPLAPAAADWDVRDPRGAPHGEAPATGASGTAVSAPRLNPRYTFNTFIVGSGNQLAHAASQAVADAPGQAYNPLFLYGGVGLGKTHLLHAIGHKALEIGLSVLYVSSETFTNEIINAIRFRTTEEFRNKYRSVDALLVDDIQFIAGKDSTEEEFFHTFNSLYEMSKQIVICSDRPPKAIVSLEERLRSRFEWGLIADIQPPDLETRVAILRAKADILGRVVPDDVITYLAGRVQSNIRELEGSFNRLLAFSQLQGLPLTVETAKAALASIASDGRQRRVSVAEVLGAVAEYYRIPEDDLRGKQRDKHIVVPRQVAMYLMRQETDASLLEIGQSLGGRDHSTVLHGCEKIGREMNENTSLRKEVLAIRQQLLG